MPISNLRRVRTVVTGVAGSPYYLNGYFDAAEGTTQQVIDAWSTFVAAGTTGASSAFPTGSTWTTESDVTVFSPVTGQPVGVETATARVLTGTGTGPFLPPTNQALVRWHTGNYENGREVRGRTNIPCQAEANSTSSGSLESAAISAFDTRAAALIATAAVSHVVWSKKNGLWWATASGSTWDQFAVLRSRRD